MTFMKEEFYSIEWSLNKVVFIPVFPAAKFLGWMFSVPYFYERFQDKSRTLPRIKWNWEFFLQKTLGYVQGRRI